MEEKKYALIFEKRIGEFLTIDIHDIDNTLINTHCLNVIDAFTKKYTEQELYDLVLGLNLITIGYNNIKVIDVNKPKSKLPIIPKGYLDDDLIIYELINNHINDKQLMNKLYQKYKIYSKAYNLDNFDEFKSDLESKRKSSAILKILIMPYKAKRELMFYIKENILITNIKENVKELKVIN